MKKIVLATLLAFASAQPAIALSCIRPDITRSYDWAEESEKTFIILRGVILAAAKNSPPGLRKPNVRPSAAMGVFTGSYLTETGFDYPVETEIRIKIGCAGPWCGSMPEGDERIYFVTVNPDGTDPTYSSEACGGNSFPVLDEAALIEHVTRSREPAPVR